MSPEAQQVASLNLTQSVEDEEHEEEQVCMGAAFLCSHYLADFVVFDSILHMSCCQFTQI